MREKCADFYRADFLSVFEIINVRNKIFSHGLNITGKIHSFLTRHVKIEYKNALITFYGVSIQILDTSRGLPDFVHHIPGFLVTRSIFSESDIFIYHVTVYDTGSKTGSIPGACLFLRLLVIIEDLISDDSNNDKDPDTYQYQCKIDP